MALIIVLAVPPVVLDIVGISSLSSACGGKMI